MRANILIWFLFLITIIACNNNSNQVIESSKKEILQTEKAFNDLARQEGIAAAFLHYAADNAVLLRSNRLIIGKEAIKSSFNNRSTKNQDISLTWEPDFVDIAASGDLGYTYGKYIYTITDSMGVARSDTGIFHTVWKRQKDGQWRFVWD